jgi:hypothetical protein
MNRQADGGTDMTKLIVAFRSFATEPKNSTERLFVFYIQYVFTLCSLNIGRRFRIVAKIAYKLRRNSLSVDPSACIIAAPAWQVSMKYDTENYFQNLSKSSTFRPNQIKISDTLHDALTAFYCCRRHKFSIKSLLYNTQYFYIFDSGI